MIEVLRGTVVTPDAVLDDGVVVIEDGMITEVNSADTLAPHVRSEPTDRVYVPGMIDVHCHGGGGFGFPDSDTNGARSAAAHHLSRGTTTMLASLVSAAPEKLLERIETLAPLVDDGTVAGLHLEGPFLAAQVCGAQDPRYIIDGDPKLLRRLLTAAEGRISSMTVAAETAHFDEIARLLHHAGAVVSVGHTAGDYDTVVAGLGVSPGPVSITHLFNGMHPMHHRDPGAVGAALTVAGKGRAVAELIGDGVHLAAGTVAMVFATVGCEHIALISDAMQAAGMPDGQYTLGPLDVTVGGGVARLTTADGTPGAIAGGTASVFDVFARAVRESGVPIVDAARAGATTPARLLGLTDRGSISPGLRADILELGPDLTLERVLRAAATV